MKVNPATLSGAVDILVVPQQDASLDCTPFHVQFGKLQLIRPCEEKIEVYVNGKRIDGLNMVLSKTGEAYFVHEVGGPNELAELCQRGAEERSGRISDAGLKSCEEVLEDSRGTALVDGLERRLLRQPGAEELWGRGEALPNGSLRGAGGSESGECGAGEVVGDAELLPAAMGDEVVATPLRLSSDVIAAGRPRLSEPALRGAVDGERVEELKESRVRSAPDSRIEGSSLRGRVELPALKSWDLSVSTAQRGARARGSSAPAVLGRPRLDSRIGGDAVLGESSDVGVDAAGKRSPSASAGGARESSERHQDAPQCLGVDSDAGSSAGDAKGSVDGEELKGGVKAIGRLYQEITPDAPLSSLSVELSSCGYSSVVDGKSPREADERFEEHRIAYEEFSRDPEVLFSRKVVVRIQGQYYPWQVAAPMLMSLLVYGSPLREFGAGRTVASGDKKVKENMPNKLWNLFFNWNLQKQQSYSVERQHLIDEDEQKRIRYSEMEDKYFAPAYARPSLIGPKAASDHAKSAVPQPQHSEQKSLLPGADGLCGEKDLVTLERSHSDDSKVQKVAHHSAARQPGELPEKEGGLAASAPWKEERSVRYVHSLKPTPKQLKNFDLKPGLNKIAFKVNSRLQGKQEVQSSIYLWERNVKIVVSDIDGTITRSDVLGQIFPVFGKDWSHKGVVSLFKNILDNGYKILYLSARAIGAAKITKEFLMSLEQDSTKLPDGPVFISPDRSLHSLNREVILRKPELFKINCLNEIKRLFGATEGPGPFYSGFGNRPTDAVSYCAVGIPSSKVFIINTLGEITGASKSIRHTYTSINELVEQIFPPYTGDTEQCTNSSQEEKWNDFNYWETRPIILMWTIFNLGGGTLTARQWRQPCTRGPRPGLWLSSARRTYHERVIDHYNNPRNMGSLNKEDKSVGTGLVGAPACGDVMKLQVKVIDGVVVDAKFKTFGCGSAIASSSLATEWIKGKTIEKCLQIKNTDIAKHLALPPVKLHCSMLAEDAIQSAIADYKLKQEQQSSSSGEQAEV
ncbi:phosphatidate phosphatase LPIN3-like [Schistocerca gregaria]|uniref:phosphatidate phosphatase LPIN3-like n=1 Tax=Schistocerca gregaria TaxID=7010 RepID=UPI00211E9678|nr:phosphatidate phosphatase LPIN3-like [Schistocerca gregaria]